jgi:hypothetical protein
LSELLLFVLSGAGAFDSAGAAFAGVVAGFDSAGVLGEVPGAGTGLVGAGVEPAGVLGGGVLGAGALGWAAGAFC